MRYGLLLVFLVISVCIYSQDKSDYTWILGKNSSNDIPGGEGNLIDFNFSPPRISEVTFSPTQALATSVGLICDKYTGELLFYSNGCVVFNKDHDLMVNGENINPGDIYEEFCSQNNTKWYPTFSGIMILPDPGNSAGYYMIHQSLRDEKGQYSINDSLRYSYIDMSGDGGRGVVLEKNVVFYAKWLDVGFTAVKHENKQDWWIFAPLHDTNEFARFLVTSIGISHMGNQVLGDSIGARGYQASFSPDGRKYAWYSPEMGLQLFDFDRATGLLSNHRKIRVTDTLDHGSMSFSSNSRFVYCADGSNIYQVDLTEDDVEEAVVKVAELELPPPFKNQLIAPFWTMTLGPDCRIYIASRNSSHFITTIDYPNLKGRDCQVSQYTFELLWPNFIGAIPNLPHFRVDEDEPCGKGTTDVIDSDFNNLQFILSPNPFSDRLSGLAGFQGAINIYNIHGQLVLASQIDGQQFEISTIQLLPGVYTAFYQGSDGAVKTQKLIKVSN